MPETWEDRPSPEGSGPTPRSPERRSFEAELPRLISEASVELPAAIDDPLFGRAFDGFADARVVLLGEASHGTSEFYRARAAVTRWLIEQHGFNIVAVEADWPDAAVIDRFVRHRPPQKTAAPPFTRFPTWMWRNREVEAFTGWLRDHNRMRPEAGRAGFHGLDLYNLSASIRAVIDYLERVDPDAARLARTRYGCLTPWSHEPATYGRSALSRGYAPCEAEVVAMLREMLEGQIASRAGDGDDFLDATMNARLVQNAEAYYRAMYYGSAESWNLRDTHMFETLEALMAARGPQAKAVVWAHNSHIGDARATEMGQARGELNLGQLCRQRWGREAALIGFGTHTGTVACASDWDEPMEIKTVLPSRPDSYEHLWRRAGRPRTLTDLRTPADLRAALASPRLQRFIGVIYRPETERWSHYVECVMPEQFDGYVWFDETTAVTPTPAASAPVEPGAEETWPFGL